MKTSLTILTLLALVLLMPAMAAAAKKGKGNGATPAPAPAALSRVVQVDALAITVNVGQSGNEQFTYRITDSTKVTLNGAPVAARDLRAGMVVKVNVSPDRSTALSIEAKDAPAGATPHPGAGRRRPG